MLKCFIFPAFSPSFCLVFVRLLFLSVGLKTRLSPLICLQTYVPICLVLPTSVFPFFACLLRLFPCLRFVSVGL